MAQASGLGGVTAAIAAEVARKRRRVVRFDISFGLLMLSVEVLAFCHCGRAQKRMSGSRGSSGSI